MKYSWTDSSWAGWAGFDFGKSVFKKKDGWYWADNTWGEYGPYSIRQDAVSAQLNYVTIRLDPPKRLLICA